MRKATRDRLPSGIMEDEKTLEGFKRVTETESKFSEKSLPGRVIQNKSSIWIQDVTADQTFSRADAAAKCGLKTAFAMPVLKGSDVAAVLEFFSETSEETDQEMIEGMELAGTQLGRVFERDEALKRLSEAEERFRQLAQRLRALSAHLQFVREQERIKIAREVHDDLGQVLSALRMELSLLNQNLLESSATRSKTTDFARIGHDVQSRRRYDTISASNHHRAPTGSAGSSRSGVCFGMANSGIQSPHRCQGNFPVHASKFASECRSCDRYF